jgi:hypothetical protein
MKFLALVLTALDGSTARERRGEEWGGEGREEE